MPNESSKILGLVRPLLEGKTVLDLGCGNEKVVPWAIGVESGEEWLEPDKLVIDVRSKIDPVANTLARDLEAAGKPLGYDVVYSSHALEHMRCPVRDAMAYWLTFVKPGGALILYLPDERYYVYDPNNPKRRNPAHRHFLTFDIIQWHVEQLAGAKIERLDPDVYPAENRYSVFVVLRKNA